eukprot:scaffold148542_cov22-Tisochrysis_lutea.AAC.1
MPSTDPKLSNERGSLKGVQLPEALAVKDLSMLAGAALVQGRETCMMEFVCKRASDKGQRTCIRKIPDESVRIAPGCRPNWAETEDWLKKLGADVVTTEEKLLESLSRCLFTCALIIRGGDDPAFADLTSCVPPCLQPRCCEQAVAFPCFLLTLILHARGPWSYLPRKDALALIDNVSSKCRLACCVDF